VTQCRVMVLENMVDADSVDDELEAEVSEECSKFGQVTRVTVATSYELPTSSADDVKVFVEFTSQSGSCHHWLLFSVSGCFTLLCDTLLLLLLCQNSCFALILCYRHSK